MKNYYLFFFLFTVLFFPSLAYAQVVINEYSCSNINTIQDNDGDYEDWIELYNTGSSAVNLGGYFLSDDINNIAKWEFPIVSIAANGYLLVYCSNKNTASGSYIHTSFKLTQTKAESIVFSNPQEKILDSQTLQITQSGHSMGLTSDGGSTWGVFKSPTPNAANSGAYDRYAEKPQFDKAPGFYSASITLALSTTEPSSEIRYTTDGSVPSASSTLYSSPLSISATTLVRAKTFSTNAAIISSFTETNTYFINETFSMPVISLASGGFTSLFDGWGDQVIVAAFEYFEKDQQFKFEGMGAVDAHGNDSWAFPQKGIDLEAKDQYGYFYTMAYPLFTDPKLSNTDRTEFDNIHLKAGASDNYPFAESQSGVPGCHLRDAFLQSFAWRYNLNVDVRRYAPCILFINGEYWGLYEIREKVDADYTDYYYGQPKGQVDMLKYWGGLTVNEGSDTAWVNLYNFVMTKNMADPLNYAYVDSVYNLKSLIDYYIYNTYIVNSDWINWNSAWWRGRNPDGDKKKWRYWLWDQDNSMGLGQNYSGWPTTGFEADPCDLETVFQNAGANMGHADMMVALMNNQSFKDQYINRYADLLNTIMNCDTIMEHLDYIIGLLTPEMPAQIARWGGSMSGWQANLDNLKDFISGRCTVIQSGVVNCYNLTGPFNITVEVDPPFSGTIKVNSITPNLYPWTGSYFGNVNMNFEAKENAGYGFQYWEVKKHAFTPDSLNKNISFLLLQEDTLIAHFAEMDSVIVPLDPESEHLFVPNAFSPNGDGNNDMLYVYINSSAEMEFTVYDRWGQKVFETTNYTKGWDGTCNGRLVNSGVYAYKLKSKFVDKPEILTGGNITLVR